MLGFPFPPRNHFRLLSYEVLAAEGPFAHVLKPRSMNVPCPPLLRRIFLKRSGILRNATLESRAALASILVRVVVCRRTIHCECGCRFFYSSYMVEHHTMLSADNIGNASSSKPVTRRSLTFRLPFISCIKRRIGALFLDGNPPFNV